MVSMNYNRNVTSSGGQYGCNESSQTPCDTAVSEAVTIRRVAESLADRLLFVMKAKGWTPYEWSQKSGLSDSTVANIITRGTNARTATLSALAVSASVSFDWLALGKGISGLDDAQEHPPDDIDAAVALTAAVIEEAHRLLPAT
jgi:transcriptional regulator with XRE-family HTH domain